MSIPFYFGKQKSFTRIISELLHTLRMSFPKIKDYPKSIFINNIEWKILFKRRITDRYTKNKNKKEIIYGLCDPNTREILIKQGQGREATYSTFLHEVIHCIEDSYSFKISHKNVYRLEFELTNIVKAYLGFGNKRSRN